MYFLCLFFGSDMHFVDSILVTYAQVATFSTLILSSYKLSIKIQLPMLAFKSSSLYDDG
jgi:hypothetical protein